MSWFQPESTQGPQHGINAIPCQKCERLKNTWERFGDQKAATRSGESSQGRSLLQSPWGKGNSEVMPHKVQHWGSAGWKGEAPNTAVESGTVPEQVLCDIIAKGHVQAKKKKVKFSKYCSPFKNHQEQLNSLCALNSPCSNSCAGTFSYCNSICWSSPCPGNGYKPQLGLCSARSSVPAQAQTLRCCWCSMDTAGDGWGTLRWEIPKCQTAYRLLLPWDPTVNISLISYPTGRYSHGMAHSATQQLQQHTPASAQPAQGAA